MPTIVSLEVKRWVKAEEAFMELQSCLHECGQHDLACEIRAATIRFVSRTPSRAQAKLLPFPRPLKAA